MEEPVSRDRWMVSYADFITVLFALFVVLFASAYQEDHSLPKISKAIHHGFVEMEPFAELSRSSNTANLHLQTARSVSTTSTDGMPRPKNDETVTTAIDIGELRRQLESAIGEDLHDGQVTMNVTPEGFVISLKELGFFDSGQADLRPGAATKVEQIAKVLGQHGFHLRVEGHSDDQPIHTAQFDSNWQLSTARAMAVLVLLINQSGMDPSMISLAGYGQYKPIADNATLDGRKVNRRVDLVVVEGVNQVPHMP
jgi:chemotaxis protein MotB